MTDNVLEVENLFVTYGYGDSTVVACDDVSLCVERNSIIGIVGESGSGKSTLLNAIARLQRPPAGIAGGKVLLHSARFGSHDLASMEEERIRALRWTSFSFVFQSAMDALNPVMRMEAQFYDLLKTHDRKTTKLQARETAGELFRMVGIAEDRLRAYPYEMSGGMRQRAAIALAMACTPDIIFMDEPTTAVDVVMQRQILGNLLELKQTLKFAIVFVTHDMSLLLEFADKIAVMYAGKVVEVGTSHDLYAHPKHPYSEMLRDSFPPLHGELRHLEGIPGSPPNLKAIPAGCPFEPRCPHRMDICAQQKPPLVDVGGTEVACWLHPGPRPRAAAPRESIEGAA